MRETALTTAVFDIGGMHCASCSILIDETVEELPGVRSSRTDLRRNRATVEYDPDSTTPARIAEAITDTGYPATPVP
jgi:copper chaperone